MNDNTTLANLSAKRVTLNPSENHPLLRWNEELQSNSDRCPTPLMVAFLTQGHERGFAWDDHTAKSDDLVLSYRFLTAAWYWLDGDDNEDDLHHLYDDANDIAQRADLTAEHAVDIWRSAWEEAACGRLERMVANDALPAEQLYPDYIEGPKDLYDFLALDFDVAFPDISVLRAARLIKAVATDPSTIAEANRVFGVNLQGTEASIVADLQAGRDRCADFLPMVFGGEQDAGEELVAA